MPDDQRSYHRITNAVKHFFTDGNSRARMFFVLLSVFLWFLIKLSKEGYTEIISFPVQYNNLPDDRILTNRPPSEIKVTLRAQGFNLLGYKFRRFRKIKVNIKEIERTASSESSYWLTNNNLSFIENQFDEGTDILSISPDTVHFKFSRISSKKVPVVFQYEKNYSNETVFRNPPRITPDSVTISGARQKVGRINAVNTQKIVLDAQKDSVQLKAPLLLKGESGIKFSHKTVEIDIHYTKLTQGKVKIPVTVTNLPDSLEIVTFPREVELSYNVAVNEYDKINEADFNVYADFSQLQEYRELRYLHLSGETYTALVTNISFNPKQVEFVITRK